MNFFLDNCMSKRLSAAAAILHQDDHHIRHITEDPRFTQSTVDLTWLPALAADKMAWNVISGDADIIDTAQERTMLMKCNLTFFCFDKHWMKTRIGDMPWKFFKIWSEIERHSRNPEPSLHLVRTGPGGRLEVEIISKGFRARGGKMRG